MPFRRAPLELTADATLETISRSRPEPVRDASDHAACLRARRPAASAPEGRAPRRQGASAWRGVAGFAEVGAAGADSAREPGLSRCLVKSRKTWVMRRICGRWNCCRAALRKAPIVRGYRAQHHVESAFREEHPPHLLAAATGPTRRSRCMSSAASSHCCCAVFWSANRTTAA